MLWIIQQFFEILFYKQIGIKLNREKVCLILFKTLFKKLNINFRCQTNN